MDVDPDLGAHGDSVERLITSDTPAWLDPAAWLHSTTLPREHRPVLTPQPVRTASCNAVFLGGGPRTGSRAGS